MIHGMRLKLKPKALSPALLASKLGARLLGKTSYCEFPHLRLARRVPQNRVQDIPTQYLNLAFPKGPVWTPDLGIGAQEGAPKNSDKLHYLNSSTVAKIERLYNPCKDF